VTLKVLLATADSSAHRTLIQILTRAGFDLLVASGEAEAWQALCAPDPPRLAILDWTIPKLNGIELCRRIRARPCPHHTYIVVLSARTVKVDLLAALAAGADDYFTRPIPRDELLARIHIGRRVLQKEERLTRITQEWRTMLDGLPFGIACLTANGELERANQAFFHLLGCNNMQDLLGKSLETIIAPHQSNFHGLLRAICSTGPLDRVEVQIRLRDGSAREVLLWGRLLRMPAGPMFEIVTTPS
jgi:PAS domain S-box-containing protein